MGYVTRWLILVYQERRTKAEKRVLYSGLFGDEIELRWRSKIYPDLRRIFQKDFSIEQAREFCTDMYISEDDLPVFKMASKDPINLNVFYSKAVGSHMVYVNVLLRDFCEGKKYMSTLLEQHDVAPEQSKAQKVEEIQNNWRNAKATFEDLDKQMSEVKMHIIEDYRKFRHERDALNKRMPTGTTSEQDR